MHFEASHFSLVSGVGFGNTILNAFDNALQCAGVGDYNLVKVSSILPPSTSFSNTIEVSSGALLPIAYSHITVSEFISKHIVATIAVGIPTDNEKIGIIMEYTPEESRVFTEEYVKKW